MIGGSITMKCKSFAWPVLLGIGGILFFIYLCVKDGNERVCSTVPAAVIASNPNLKRSFAIEKAKRQCIKQRICHPDHFMGSYPCEFTAYDLKECKDLDPALADYKTTRRHLEAEVETCELGKVENRYGVTVYQWMGEQ